MQAGSPDIEERGMNRFTHFHVNKAMGDHATLATLGGSDAIRIECQRAFRSKRRCRSAVSCLRGAEISVVVMMFVVGVFHVILVMLAPSIRGNLPVAGDASTACIAIVCLGCLLLSLYSVQVHVTRMQDQNQQFIDELLLLLERLRAAIPDGLAAQTALSERSSTRKRASRKQQDSPAHQPSTLPPEPPPPTRPTALTFADANDDSWTCVSSRARNSPRKDAKRPLLPEPTASQQTAIAVPAVPVPPPRAEGSPSPTPPSLPAASSSTVRVSVTSPSSGMVALAVTAATVAAEAKAEADAAALTKTAALTMATKAKAKPELWASVAASAAEAADAAAAASATASADATAAERALSARRGEVEAQIAAEQARRSEVRGQRTQHTHLALLGGCPRPTWKEMRPF